MLTSGKLLSTTMKRKKNDMKVTEYTKSNGLDKFVLDDKMVFIYDMGSDLSISYTLYKLLLNAYKKNEQVTNEQIAESI